MDSEKERVAVAIKSSIFSNPSAVIPKLLESKSSLTWMHRSYGRQESLRRKWSTSDVLRYGVSKWKGVPKEKVVLAGPNWRDEDKDTATSLGYTVVEFPGLHQDVTFDYVWRAYLAEEIVKTPGGTLVSCTLNDNCRNFIRLDLGLRFRCYFTTLTLDVPTVTVLDKPCDAVVVKVTANKPGYYNEPDVVEVLHALLQYYSGDSEKSKDLLNRFRKSVQHVPDEVELLDDLEGRLDKLVKKFKNAKATDSSVVQTIRDRSEALKRDRVDTEAVESLVKKLRKSPDGGANPSVSTKSPVEEAEDLLAQCKKEREAVGANLLKRAEDLSTRLQKLVE